jgi:butyryl-CoA dehydrogenase
MRLEEMMDRTVLEDMLTEEQKMFRNVVRQYCKREVVPNTKEWAAIDGFCRPLVDSLAGAGLLGLCVPEEYGGSGGTIVDLVILSEELARTGMSIPLTHMSSPAMVISRFANEGFKRKYLPDLATGKKIFCYAQTEPGAGSDVSAMESFAALDGDYYYITGRKVFITNSTVGDVFILLAKTDKTMPGTTGISTFIVERESEGLTIGKMEKKMGRKSYPMSEMILDNCKVPKENLIVKHGDGFKKMMTEFNGERIGNTSMCVGYAWGALERAIEYSGQRKVSGGRLISSFQGIRWMFADMINQLMASRMLMYNAAIKFARGDRVAAYSAICKSYANEMVQKVTSDSMQVLGAYGYMEEYELERYYRDSRGLALGGGSTQILRNRIASELLR